MNPLDTTYILRTRKSMTDPHLNCCCHDSVSSMVFVMVLLCSGLRRKFLPTTERTSPKPHNYVKRWTCETIFDADTRVDSRIVVDIIKMLINKNTGEQHALTSTSDPSQKILSVLLWNQMALCFQRFSLPCFNFFVYIYIYVYVFYS